MEHQVWTKVEINCVSRT